MEQKLKAAEGNATRSKLSTKGPAAPKSAGGPAITPSKGKKLGGHTGNSAPIHSTGAKGSAAVDPKRGMPRNG